MDPVVGRLQAALASATNEITVAAANFNFDFSIVKYEAPKEFHPVGKLLSAKRKYEAEDGSCHIIARRLAALFAGVCPKCPELIKAYGQRASEIAGEATSKESKEHFDSVFSQYTGVDATSMWAAATSSKDADGSAIQVHLLACLLASMWEAPQAISIWVQIIAERRSEIALRLERGELMDYATAAAAAQQEIPRKQLAEWDASARSWLETANGIKRKERTQLKVILENIESPVPRQPTVYKNVVEVWKTASTTMDNLVSGIAQEVYAGTMSGTMAGTMIGLSAWHLYPDMHVFGKRNVQIKMHDSLIPAGGTLSLGCSPSATTPESGITWSLSLANLKFYGDPVESTAHMQGDSSRLTIEGFRVTLLGCVLRIWNIEPTQESITIRLLAALSLRLLGQLREWDNESRKDNGWYGNYVTALTLLEKAEAHYRDDELGSISFINLGKNRPEFRPKEYTKDNKKFGSRPFFGLLDSKIFLKCMRSPEDRVSALRRCGSRIEKLRNSPAIIRYKTAENEVHYTTLTDNSRWVDPDLTVPVGSAMRFDDADSCDGKTTSSHGDDRHGTAGSDKRESNEDGDYEDNILYAAFGSLNLSVEDDDGTQDGSEESCDDEYDYDESDDENDDNDPAPFTTLLFVSEGQSYRFYFGESDIAAIFVPVGYHGTSLPFFEPEDIFWALDQDVLTGNGRNFIATDAMIPWLSQFEYALRCLQGLSGPVISVRTLKNTSYTPKWVEELQSIFSTKKWDPTTPEILSVLAYFLGGCNIGPSELRNSTMGISYGNSIYVPTELLHDPLLSRTEHRSVTRILGNVGLPGLVIFSSVGNPKAASVDDTLWKVVNPNQFDGRPENHFGSTSMHLSFTQWERSLDMVSSQGQQDVQFTRKESVISVRESGRWIGDFDVMAALRSPHIYTLSPQAPCDHAGDSQPPNQRLRSIECWDELRECQSGLVVVRVHGNWLARLAVTAYLAQRADQCGDGGPRITLLPAKVCWICLEHDFHSNIYIY
ncbi:hypothetical protein F4820DRAFT_450971 [Hypoxylon rubiginosum]|uniref:Uncharacterized protein n=1 Tax=Hypoxylon rubiginosum TaxID=110542 RepID=A0ACB9YSL1_9PEZI|nr:hypothetical protein F4820DRAFT_450971 [Hypoxylon rubiginosum]